MAHLIHHWTTLAPLAAAALLVLTTAIGEQPWLLVGCVTVPVVVFFATAYGLPLVLGLDPKDIVLLATALLVSVVTLGTGRTSMMQGAVHLVLFATYLFLACVP
jgi:Ca2+:H+ antiporter